MATFSKINSFIPEFNENLLPNTSVFSNYTTINKISGNSTSAVITDDDYSFEKTTSIKSYNDSNSTPLVFNLGSSLNFTTRNDGVYILSLRVRHDDTTVYDDRIKVNVFIESINTYQFELSLYDIISESGIPKNNWICFAQSMNINSGKTVSFSFEHTVDATKPSGISIIWIDGIKIELDDRSLGLPSIYTLPKYYFLTESNDLLKNIYHGWGYYADSLATPTITIGTSYTQLTIDALGALTNENYLPLEIRGTDSLWSGNKITPIAVGDDYDGRLDVTITAKTGSPTFIEVILDISGSTAGSNKVFTGYIQTGGTTPYDQSLPLDFFSLSTFLSNGGRIYAKVDTGSVIIGRRNIKISRKSKAF